MVFMDSKSVQRYLDTCRAIEIAAAAIYDNLAKAHAAHPEVAEVWQRTADDERDHAHQYDLMSRLEEWKLLAPAVPQAQADAALRQAEILVKQSLHAPPDVAEALQRCIQLEKELADFHAGNAVVFEDKSYRQLFGKLGSSDKEHVGGLKKALAQWKKRG